MNYYLSMNKQLDFVERMIKAAEYDAKNDSGISLIIGNRNGNTEWFTRKGNEARHYLSKTEEDLARQLAQVAYAKDFLKVAVIERRILADLCDKGLSRSAAVMYAHLAEPYARLSDMRKKLVHAYVLPVEEFVHQWENTAYQGKSFMPDTPLIFTEKGERVRSKSEKLIADKLLLLGVPYRYEYPVHLKRGALIHADFCLLDTKERTEVIHEHFGLMDHADYSNSVIWKISQYENNGFRMGDRLLCTFESGDQVLNVKDFEKVIRDRFHIYGQNR